jgi:hypothetical protein
MKMIISLFLILAQKHNVEEISRKHREMNVDVNEKHPSIELNCDLPRSASLVQKEKREKHSVKMKKTKQKEEDKSLGVGSAKG